MEDRPALTVRRRVVGLEHVEAELRIRPAAKVAEIPLAQQRLDGEGSGGGLPDVLRSRQRAGVVAGDDPRDAFRGEAARQPLGLCDAAGGERDIRALDDPERVAVGLAVPDQEEPAHRPPSCSVRSTGGSAASTSRRQARTRVMLASALSGTSPRDTLAMNSSRLVAISSEALISSWSA